MRYVNVTSRKTCHWFVQKRCGCGRRTSTSLPASDPVQRGLWAPRQRFCTAAADSLGCTRRSHSPNENTGGKTEAPELAPRQPPRIQVAGLEKRAPSTNPDHFSPTRVHTKSGYCEGLHGLLSPVVSAEGTFRSRRDERGSGSPGPRSYQNLRKVKRSPWTGRGPGPSSDSPCPRTPRPGPRAAWRPQALDPRAPRTPPPQALAPNPPGPGPRAPPAPSPSPQELHSLRIPRFPGPRIPPAPDPPDPCPGRSGRESTDAGRGRPAEARTRPAQHPPSFRPAPAALMQVARNPAPHFRHCSGQLFEKTNAKHALSSDHISSHRGDASECKRLKPKYFLAVQTAPKGSESAEAARRK